jgi:magnesium-transporting ATPase (P-type)
MALRGGEPAVLELPDLMTLKNVARLLGESLSTTRHRHHRGELGGSTPSRLKMISVGQHWGNSRPENTHRLPNVSNARSPANSRGPATPIDSQRPSARPVTAEVAGSSPVGVATTLMRGRDWRPLTDRWCVDGTGYSSQGHITRVAGELSIRLDPILMPMVLASDAIISDGVLIGDPTERALVALAAKGGVDAVSTRERYPRTAELPFDAA